MNIDRLVFDIQTLSNGITVYAKPHPVPFVLVEVIIPLGHKHNNGTDIPFGAVHMLEHLVCEQSQGFPKRHLFAKRISNKYFGYFNASTNVDSTKYILQVPSKYFSVCFAEFIDHIFNPLFLEKDFGLERSIIANEAKNQSPWYPANSRLNHYCCTGWKKEVLMPQRQTLGEKDDLKQITIPILEKLHEQYLSKETTVFVGGTFDTSVLTQVLEKIPTKNTIRLATQVQDASWVHREYHEHPCTDGQFYYHLGGIVPEVTTNDFSEVLGLQILSNLTTSTHDGILYQWLRNTLGWSYEMNYSYMIHRNNQKLSWELWIACNSSKEGRHIKKWIRPKIEQALTGKRRIDTVVKRIIGNNCYNFQMIGTIMGVAQDHLQTWGVIYSEKEINDLLHQQAEPGKLKAVYERFCALEHIGEFLATPKQ